MLELPWFEIGQEMLKAGGLIVTGGGIQAFIGRRKATSELQRYQLQTKAEHVDSTVARLERHAAFLDARVRTLEPQAALLHRMQWERDQLIAQVAMLTDRLRTTEAQAQHYHADAERYWRELEALRTADLGKRPSDPSKK